MCHSSDFFFLWNHTVRRKDSVASDFISSSAAFLPEREPMLFFLDFFPPVPTIYERYFVFVVWNLIEEKKRRHQFFSLCLLASFCAIVNQTWFSFFFLGVCACNLRIVTFFCSSSCWLFSFNLVSLWTANFFQYCIDKTCRMLRRLFGYLFFSNFLFFCFCLRLIRPYYEKWACVDEHVRVFVWDEVPLSGVE